MKAIRADDVVRAVVVFTVVVTLAWVMVVLATVDVTVHFTVTLATVWVTEIVRLTGQLFVRYDLRASSLDIVSSNMVMTLELVGKVDMSTDSHGETMAAVA